MVANKLDLTAAGPRLAAFRRARGIENLETVAVSARERDGVADLVRAVAALLPGAAESRTAAGTGGGRCPSLRFMGMVRGRA